MVVDDNGAKVAPASCNFGDYYHDADDKIMYLCVSGKNKILQDSIDVNAVYCRETCPKTIVTCDEKVELDLSAGAS